MRHIGNHLVPVKITDYGPGARGIDIASKNKSWARNFPFQGQIERTARTIGHVPRMAGNLVRRGFHGGRRFPSALGRSGYPRAIAVGRRGLGNRGGNRRESGSFGGGGPGFGGPWGMGVPAMYGGGFPSSTGAPWSDSPGAPPATEVGGQPSSSTGQPPSDFLNSNLDITNFDWGVPFGFGNYSGDPYSDAGGAINIGEMMYQ